MPVSAVSPSHRQIVRPQLGLGWHYLVLPRTLQAPNNTMVESDLKAALLDDKAKRQQLHRIWRRIRKRLLNGLHINLFVGRANNKAVNCVRLLKGAESGELALNSIETRSRLITLARWCREAVNEGDIVAGGVEESHSDWSDLEEDEEHGSVPAALPGLVAESSLDEQIVNFVIQQGPQVIARFSPLSSFCARQTGFVDFAAAHTCETLCGRYAGRDHHNPCERAWPPIQTNHPPDYR